ncbi:hypothetical protein FQN51_003210 [Onygenales sp. PD_10]|nr:hypothetical protein FQN51_003210 [Onygenales sp. PD_10]
MHSLTSTALLGLLFLLIATINPAAAQNDKTGTKCAAQNILDACLKSTKLTLENCPVNDWECLCARYTDVLTCYNNCPSDQGKFAIESSQLANCNAAKQYAKPTTTTTTTTATNTAASTGATGTPTGTETDKPSSGGDGDGDVPTETASKTVSGAAASGTGTVDSAAVAVVGRGVGGVVGLVGVGLGMGMGMGLV